MQQFWRIMAALTLSSLLGYELALCAPWQDSKTIAGHAAQASRSPELQSGSSFALPVAAQQAWFPPIASYIASGKPLEDEEFNTLLRILQERMEAKETTADFEREAGFYLDGFLRRIAASKLTPAQIQNADDYLLGLARQHPEHRSMIEQERQLLKNYGPKRKPLKAIAVADTWFPGVETLDTGGEPFADETIDELIDVLDGLLAAPEGVFSSNSRTAARIHVAKFLARLKLGLLTDLQTAWVDTYLDQVKERYPDESGFLDLRRHQVRNLLPGREAPNITGNDLGGDEFELREYRGDIAVLYFSGQWCAPCRTEYPYQRFMLELFKDEPVTILGVNSDEDIGTIREAKEREGLDYRVWWDGYGEEPTKGPIATAWNVRRWPTVYILDGQGVIRFVEKRHAEVITAVNKLLKERKSGMAP